MVKVLFESASAQLSNSRGFFLSQFYYIGIWGICTTEIWGGLRARPRLARGRVREAGGPVLHSRPTTTGG